MLSDKFYFLKDGELLQWTYEEFNADTDFPVKNVAAIAGNEVDGLFVLESGSGNVYQQYKDNTLKGFKPKNVIFFDQQDETPILYLKNGSTYVYGNKAICGSKQVGEY